ncbi:MAG: TetR/AcrR family transcriptional regulator [Micromonosporaceae bacterium]
MTSDGERTVGLLWGLREPPSRGPKPALSVDRIADAAVRIADAEGLGSVAMQRVAGELDFTKMSLYRYVAGKSELVAVMIEAAVGEPPELDGVPGGWRGRLTEWARLMWATWERHPWLPGATEGDRMMGPRESGWVEVALRALEDTGLDATEKLNVVRLLSGHIRNTQSAQRAGTGLDPAQFGAAFTDVLEENRDRYPALLAAGSTAATSDARAFGLDLILDGVGLLVTHRAR